MRKILKPVMMLLLLASSIYAAPNPSAVYCTQFGYEYQNRTDPTGGQVGWCIFPDDSECTAWSFWYKCHGADCTKVNCDCHWPCPGPATIIYVDTDSPGPYDGSSWTTAFIFLQDALAYARNQKKPIEIRVAQGTYKPDHGWQQTIGDRDAAFELINDTTIKGGFAGLGATDPNDRNIALYETILSGDLADNDAPTTNLRTLSNDPTRADNSYHLVVSNNNDASASIDGFTITAGNANGPTYTKTYGAGVYVDSGSAIVANCTFKLNSSSDRGGGFYSQSGENILFRCHFTQNISRLGGGLCGYHLQRTEQCSFENNISTLNGGGMWGKSKQVNACTFISNHADNSGGGLFNIGNATFANCLFATNQSRLGGGMYAQDCDISLKHCTFACNSADQYAGLHNDEGETTIMNSILWGNSDAFGYVETAQIKTAFIPTINYCCIQNWTDSLGGAGNFGNDPLFADPNACNFHLKSQAGRWDPITQSWLQDSQTSPCIDAGDPSDPIGLEPFPNGGFTNLGAYGGSTLASKTWFDAPICETIVAGDINGDCIVNFTDFSIMALHWLADNTSQ